MHKRQSRSQIKPTIELDPINNINPVSSRSCKSSISFFLLSTFSNNESNPSSRLKKKVKSFTHTTLRNRLGCTADDQSQQVCLPTVIKTSAGDWDEKRKKKVLILNKKKTEHVVKTETARGRDGDDVDGGYVVGNDVWCGSRIGLCSDLSGSVDCLPIDDDDDDGDKITKREEEPLSKFPVRRTVSPERVSFRDSDSLPVVREQSDIVGGRYDRHARHPSPDSFSEPLSKFPVRRTVSPERVSFRDSDSLPVVREQSDIVGGRYDRHARHPSPDSFSEILILGNSLQMVGRLDSRDQFRDWRLNVDDMTYEELLGLGDRIGYVSTGLKEDEINCCLRKIKPLNLNDPPSKLQVHIDKKCTICQFEYEEGEEMGKLDCGHTFHILCIKQWLEQKNSCPVCKTAAVARR